MKNRAQIESITHIYEDEIAYFESKLKPIVHDLTYTPHFSYSKDNALSLLNQVNKKDLSLEAQQVLETAKAATLQLLYMIKLQNQAADLHNKEIQDQLKSAKKNYHHAIMKVIPSDLKDMADCLVIRKRHVHPDDNSALQISYKNLGLDYVQINPKMDFVFYNRTINKFLDLAKMIESEFLKHSTETTELFKYIQNMPLSNSLEERVPIIIEAYSNRSLIC